MLGPDYMNRINDNLVNASAASHPISADTITSYEYVANSSEYTKSYLIKVKALYEARFPVK